jgi:hypothetical protein
MNEKESFTNKKNRVSFLRKADYGNIKPMIKFAEN